MEKGLYLLNPNRHEDLITARLLRLPFSKIDDLAVGE